METAPGTSPYNSGMHVEAFALSTPTVESLTWTTVLLVLVVDAAVRVVVCLLTARVVAKVLTDEAKGKRAAALRRHRLVVLRILVTALRERHVFRFARGIARKANARTPPRR
jgi:nitrogen fixation/metabolism regulation signal transduction histidine kinase